MNTATQDPGQVVYIDDSTFETVARFVTHITQSDDHDWNHLRNLIDQSRHYAGTRPLRTLLEHGVFDLQALATGVADTPLEERLLQEHVTADAVAVITVKRAQRLKVVPTCIEGDTITLFHATGQTLLRQSTDEIDRVLAEQELRPKWRTAKHATVRAVLDSLGKIGDTNRQDSEDDTSLEEAVGNWHRLASPSPDPDASEAEVLLTEQITKQVVELMSTATSQEASDIHIANVLENDGQPRVECEIRLDGDLQVVQNLPPKIGRGVINRFKVTAGMEDRAEQFQDKSLDLRSDSGSRYTLRLNVLPLAGRGEQLTMRIQYQDQETIRSLTDIYPPAESDVAAQIEDLFRSHAEGMILLSGQTGDGKSTTLAALVTAVADPTIRVLTIEDPIEYRIPGARQVQAHPKHRTFEMALRAFMRADPNVILVGEIRDKITAQAAVDAAETGHIVLSTVHAGNAAKAATRLINLGLEPWQVTGTVIGVLGQRLLPTLCGRCSSDGQPRGCEHCKEGWDGRAAVADLLPYTAEVAEMVHRKEQPEVVLQQCSSNMAEHVSRLVRLGRTTVNVANKIGKVRLQERFPEWGQPGCEASTYQGTR